jgi:hypothetical protein
MVFHGKSRCDNQRTLSNVLLALQHDKIEVL